MKASRLEKPHSEVFEFFREIDWVEIASWLDYDERTAHKREFVRCESGKLQTRRLSDLSLPELPSKSKAYVVYSSRLKIKIEKENLTDLFVQRTKFYAPRKAKDDREYGEAVICSYKYLSAEFL